MESILLKFLESEYSIDVSNMDKEIKDQFVLRLMIFLFSHRHEKEDLFITETRAAGDVLDFSIVRDVMYKYSKKAQEKFLTYPIECFFLIKFAESKEGWQFIIKKADPSEISDKTQRILKEMTDLKNQAIATLKSSNQENAETLPLRKFLIEHISGG